MDNPRILFIVPLPPPVHGSAMVSQAIRDSSGINRSYHTCFVNLSTSRTMTEIGRHGWRKVARLFGSYAKAFYQLVFRRCDAAYLAITCHGIGFLKDFPFVALCKLFAPKVILHLHNKGLNKDIHRWPYRWLMPWAFRHAEVILLSERLYADVSSVVHRKQVHICPNGLSTPLPEETSCRVSVPHLLFLSNLIESKGVSVLLDACRALKDRGYSFVCDFVGGETKEITRNQLEEGIRQRNLEGYVAYHGSQYGIAKEHFFRTADIFVQPTFEDCFPLTLIEAMQHGLPVVSTDEGAIPDMIVDGENGFVCPRRNVDALVNAIEKLLNDSELRKQMGENGRFRYKERYTLEAFDKTFQGILSDILN